MAVKILNFDKVTKKNKFVMAAFRLNLHFDVSRYKLRQKIEPEKIKSKGVISARRAATTLEIRIRYL
jgi:hypothetical protein